MILRVDAANPQPAPSLLVNGIMKLKFSVSVVIAVNIFMILIFNALEFNNNNNNNKRDLEMRGSFRGGRIDSFEVLFLFFIIISRAENNFILCFKP